MFVNTVIPWDDGLKRARSQIWQKLDGPVFLVSNNQFRDFPRFLGEGTSKMILVVLRYIVSELAIEDFEAQNIEGIRNLKPIKEFDSPQILDVDNAIYLVTGPDKIFLLGEDAGDEWARLLTEDEIDNLPFDIHWDGQILEFKADSKSATELSKQILLSFSGCIMFL